MDARRKHWKDNTFTPFLNESDVLEEDAPLQSFSEETPADKSRRMGRIFNFVTKKVQEENTFNSKDCYSQIVEGEQGRNLGERRMHASKSVANTDSAFLGLLNLGGANNATSLRRESASAWSRKELSTATHGTGKKWSEEMPPKLRLHLLNEELGELNLKCREIEEDFENAEKELLNSRKEASMKSVNVQEPGTAASKNDRELHAFKNDLSEKVTSFKNLTEELHQTKEAMYRLDMENRNLKDTLLKLKHQTELSTALLREEMKLFYELEMEKIRLELGAIKNELRAERTLRAKNSRNLELLGRQLASIISSSHTTDHFPRNTF